MAGEITTDANVDYGRVARDTIRRIGYNDPELRFDADGCAVMVCYGRQSPDIAQGVDRASDDYLNQGAGDQGLMFGYACDETPTLMPFPIYYAHRLVQRQSEVRRDGRLPFLRPDAKSQVTVRYVDGKPESVDTVVLSTQHHPSMNEKQKELAEAVIEEIIKPVFPKDMLDGTRFLVNPTGRFEIGGPHGDAGLTGRKIIVDTYGGAAPHGGGAFSGKDPSKVDRSAAYAARYVAKNIVAAGLARQCQVQLSYAIGVAQPDQRHRLHRGHRQDSGREDRRARQRALRPAAEGHHPDARPAAPDLSEDRGLRPLRPRRARVHVGEHRSRRRAARGGGAQGRSGARDRLMMARAAWTAIAGLATLAGCGVLTVENPFDPPPVPIRLNDATTAPLTVARGQSLVVTLDANVSTGYRWEALPAVLARPDADRNGRLTARRGQRPGKSPVDGRMTFIFLAAAPGTRRSNFAYRRPFEPTVAPAKTVRYDVTVR